MRSDDLRFASDDALLETLSVVIWVKVLFSSYSRRKPPVTPQSFDHRRKQPLKGRTDKFRLFVFGNRVVLQRSVSNQRGVFAADRTGLYFEKAAYFLRWLSQRIRRSWTSISIKENWAKSEKL